MSQPKIFMMSSVHPWNDTRIFHREAKSLAKKYEIELHAIADFRFKESYGVKIFGLPKIRRILRIANWLRLFYRILKSKADVYHFQDPELILLGIIIKVVKRKKVIYDVHEDVPNQILTKEWIPFYLRFIISKLFAFLERMCFSFFDVVVVADKDIAIHFPFSQKITVIRNFPLLKVTEKINIKKKEKKEPFVSIYVGGLTRNRGIEEMVEAVHYIKSDTKLVLVGSFDDPNLERKIKEKADKRVEFVGQIPYEKVFQYLKKADIGLVLLHPIPNFVTMWERNNKIFEYMASGLPIVASNFPGWEKMIEEEGYGITVDPLNPKNIARGIEELIKNPEKRRKMGQKGRKDFLEKYNWKREKEKLLKIYEDL